MIFGIKYSGNTRRGIRAMNNSMQKYGCAIMLNGKLEYYFDNVFSAIKTAHTLQKAHNGLVSYNVFKVEKDYERRIPADKILSSYDEYSSIMEHETQQAIKKLEELRNPSSTLEPASAETEATM